MDQTKKKIVIHVRFSCGKESTAALSPSPSEANWDQLQLDWKRLARFSNININLTHLEAVNQPETALKGPDRVG